MIQRASNTFSIGSAGSMDDLYINRQSELYRELEVLLELTPRTFSSSILALPREIRDQIFDWVLPRVTDARPELHTCLWGSDMVNGSPGDMTSTDTEHRWRLQIGYLPNYFSSTSKSGKNFCKTIFAAVNLLCTLNCGTPEQTTTISEYSPHILQLPMLKYVTHIHFYVEWNYTTRKHVIKEQQLKDQVRMTDDLLKAMDKIIFPLQAIETIELSVLFFWKYRSGKVYSLSMQDLFDLEDVFKRYAEQSWLTLLRKNKSASVMSPNPSAGVGYKLSSEKKGTEQSGGMEIFVSQDLEDAMKVRRRSNVDFYTAIMGFQTPYHSQVIGMGR